MPTDLLVTGKLKFAQVLAIQIVPGPNSKVSQDDVEALFAVVQKTDAFRGAEITGKARRFFIPGGLALVFTSTPDAPVRCAIQISKALQKHLQFRLRMGIHHGPVGDLSDTDEFSTPVEAGFQQAIRVMECGNADHILLTREMAGVLG